MSAPSSAAPSPSPSPSSLRPWHLAGGLLATAVLGLALYGLWPVLTGQAQDETAREEFEQLIRRQMEGEEEPELETVEHVTELVAIMRLVGAID